MKVKPKPKLHICFVFASKGIGGAERSMARFMEIVHPDKAVCHVILVGNKNPAFSELLDGLEIGYTHVSNYNWLKLALVLQQHQTDVAYLFGNLRTIPWAWLARLKRVPVIVAAERNIPTGRFRIWARRIEQYFVDGYICNSEAARQILHNLCYIPNQNIRVIYNGIQSKMYSKTVEDPSVEPTILCVANLQPRKGQVVLLEAAKRLREKYPGLQVNLVGSDFTDGAFFSQIEARGLQNVYRWFGYVTDVDPYLQAADVFVLPSLAREGTPTSILEAMLAGLPVIASDVGGVSELIQDGVTGYVVKPGDIEMLAERLDQLLSLPAVRHQLGRAGRTYVLEHHTLEKMASNHLQVFQQLLKDS